ncbi:MAG: hypothetical protein M1546_20580 [Chloroflexi bacterium]|nr:hypothetical protein [Chloroflexota bacterium]
MLDIGQVIFNAIANPDIAYALLILGLFSAIIAFAVPGTGFAEIAAGLCLLLAVIGLAQLPVNAAGVLLILLGIVLFILDLKLQIGAMAIGGAVALGVGSLFLFQPSPAQTAVSIWLIALVTISSAAFFGFGLTRAVQVMRLRPKVGLKTIVGVRGIVKTPILASNQWTGIAQVGSEEWTVRSEEALPQGAAVIVDRVDGLILHVSKADSPQQQGKAVDQPGLS